MLRHNIFFILLLEIVYNNVMTQISRDDVLHLAQLSSLQLDETEIEPLQRDLAGIVDYINQLSELDTSGVEPTYQVTDLKNVWREDKVDNYNIDREKLLQLASKSKNNQIEVPKVL
jgi:aspartyl-tRNA(Asn)/glutamyl-tRNA(Gln) amidotransferase subunit C